MELNDIGIGVFCVLIVMDIYLTWAIYVKEYKDNENKKDI